MSEGAALVGDLAWWARVIPPALAWVKAEGLDGDFAEELARIDPEGEADPQEAQWEAYVALRRRTALPDEVRHALFGKALWELEFEAIEAGMSEEAILDDWAMTLAELSAVANHEEALRLITKAESLAFEYQRYAPSLMNRTLFRLEILREERTEALSRTSGRE